MKKEGGKQKSMKVGILIREGGVFFRRLVAHPTNVGVSKYRLKKKKTNYMVLCFDGYV